MRSEELISNEEMSALMPENEQKKGDGSKSDRIVPYNFRRPDRLSKDQIRSIYLLHDLFAHSLSSSLPLFLRAMSEVNLISVEQQTYGEYLRGLADPTTIYTISVEALRGVFAIEINSSIAFPVIDRMLGGSGDELKEKRAATELELNILESFLNLVTENYEEAWNPIVDFETEVVGRETRPQLLQVVSPNEVVVTIVYQMQIGEAQGSLSICLPIGLLEPIIEKFNPSTYSQSTQTSPQAVEALISNLSLIEFPVSTELQKISTTFADLMELSEGDVLLTSHRIEKPLMLSIRGEKKFHGRIAALENRMVVQVSDKTPSTNQAKA